MNQNEPAVPSGERDTDFISQRKQAIRLGQAGVLLLIVVALCTFFLRVGDRLSPGHVLALLGTAFLFAVCSLWGTRRINQYFQHGYRAEEVPDALLGTSRVETLVHFVSLYVLTFFLYWIAIDLGEVRSLWLFLLIPIGHAALFLPISGHRFWLT